MSTSFNTIANIWNLLLRFKNVKYSPYRRGSDSSPTYCYKTALFTLCKTHWQLQSKGLNKISTRDYDTNHNIYKN